MPARETRNSQIKDLSTNTKRIISAGLQIYVRNAKAASGTVTGLRHTEMATELTEEIEHITADIAPLFDEQTDAFVDSESQGELAASGS